MRKHCFHIKYSPGMLLLISVWFSSCESVGDCFNRTGENGIEVRELVPFHKITIEDNINVQLVQDSHHKVKIEGGRNLLPEVESYTENQTLYLTNTNSCEWARTYPNAIHATVHFGALNQIIYKGSGKIETSDTVSVNNLNIIIEGGNHDIKLQVRANKITVKGISGSGDITMDGFADTLEVEIHHAGLIDFSGCPARVVNIYHGGTNHAFIHATGHLFAQIVHVGDVYVEGEPETIELKSSGEGELLEK